MPALLFFIYLILSVAGVLLFKMGSMHDLTHFSLLSGTFQFRISLISVAGLLCYLCSFLLYMGLVAKSNLTWLAPIACGSIYILTVIGAVILFKEKMTPVSIMGMAMILTGILIVGLQK